MWNDDFFSRADDQRERLPGQDATVHSATHWVLNSHIILQQEDAPSRWGLQARPYLNRTFAGRWIGRGGPMPWPPRSPDITPLDSFLWSYVKSSVFKSWLEDPYPECNLGYSSGHTPQNKARARISSARYPCYQESPHRGLLRSVKNFQSFTVILLKPRVATQFVCASTFF
jgi:hypothetical protein